MSVPKLSSSVFHLMISSGSKVFAANPNVSVSFKFVSMILACTGGGILVPLFINSIPVPMANDAYPIAIATSFAIHHYFPIIGEVVKLSPMVNVCYCDSFFISIAWIIEETHDNDMIVRVLGNDHRTL